MTKIHAVGLDTNTQGSRCNYYAEQVGSFYQWLSDGQPCIYTAAFLFGYVFYFTLYLLFDYVRRRIIGYNPALIMRLKEVSVWFMLHWLCLLFLTITTFGNVNISLLGASFWGTLLFMLPFFFIAVAMHYIKSKTELWILSF